MLSKVETFGCATPLKDVSDANAADFAALLNMLLSATCSERGNFDRTADQQCVRIFVHARSQIFSYFCRLTLLPLLFALHFPACAELQHCFSFFVTEPPRAFPIRSDQTSTLKLETPLRDLHGAEAAGFAALLVVGILAHRAKRTA